MGQTTYKNCVIIGFMGCGKSTIAKNLRKLGEMNIIDMDKKIEQMEGMSIPEIFETKGEDYFRQLETSLLIQLQKAHNTVVSCGGGVPLREINRQEMKKIGPVIWLNTSPETILNRVKRNDRRPLLRGNKNIDFVKNMMDSRKDAYSEASDLVVDTDHKSIKQICYEILDFIKVS